MALRSRLPQSRRSYNGVEFTIIAAIAFGWTLVAGMATLDNYGANNFTLGASNRDLLDLLSFEVVAGVSAALFLWFFGWRWQDFHVNISSRGTVEGVVLAAVAAALLMGVDRVMGPVDALPPTASMGWILATALVNPWYEELLVNAFVIESLREEFMLAGAVAASLAIRVLFHMYQGPQAAVGFALFGLLVTLFYVYTGRLWPAVLAHAVLDLVGLAGY